MEESKRIAKHLQNGVKTTSLAYQIHDGENSRLLIDCSDEEIIQAFRYIMALIGIRKENMPNVLETNVLVHFTRKKMRNIRILELKNSFEMAISGEIEVDLNLYGQTFSAKYINDVLHAFSERKNSIKRTLFIDNNEVKMNNTQRLSAISNLLTHDTKNKISDIVSMEKKTVERKKLPYEDLHQKWFKQFDRLHLKYGLGFGGPRFIKRYGQVLNIEMYFEKKMQQLQIAKTRQIDLL